MSWKNLAQNSLTDALASHHSAIEELDAVHDIINWKQIQKPLSSLYQGTRGAPSYPPLILFKILILQAWYGLSDPAMEKQLARDLMFRRFIDLSLSEQVPDHSTIWRFRQLLQEQQLLTPLLELINDQLEQASLIVSHGSISIIDATIIEAKNSRPRKNKHGEPTQDTDAKNISKKDSKGQLKTTYGYKLHANTDEDGFVKALQYTPANVHDSQVFEKLLTGDEEQVYADSAYASKKNDDLLGDKNRILERAYRNKPLTEAQKRNNKKKSSIRSTVERVFGLMKLHQGLAKARYMGLARNQTRAQLIAMSHNLKCGLSIYKKMQQSQDTFV